MARDLRYLAEDPLRYRKLNYTRPGAAKCSLYEADDYIAVQLAACGYAVERTEHLVQCFRCDPDKPKAHQYSAPLPEDPWSAAYNLNARKTGTDRPGDTIVLVAHKDSQSWVDSPGALDNGVGTVGVMEIARVLCDVPLAASVWFLFCNEEHTPWTSAFAANAAAERGENLMAVFNLDSLGGRSQQDIDAGRMTNVTAYTEEPGRALAELMAGVNDRYGIGLIQTSCKRDSPGDDDGSFVRAGFPAAVINLGSFPYADPCYHTEEDEAGRVDVRNVRMAVQATLAAVLELAG
jgi:hypothetical protein